MSKEIFDFSEAMRRMKDGKKVRRNGCYFSLSINKYKEISILYQKKFHRIIHPCCTTLLAFLLLG